MLVALIRLFHIAPTIAQFVGSLIATIGFHSSDLKLIVGGMEIVLVAIAVSEGLKCFCRCSNDRFDAYTQELGVPPLPSRSWRQFQAFLRGRRAQEVR